MLLFSGASSRVVEYSHPRRARVLGCMSGTSVDGIDVACVDLELDGDELGCGYRGVLGVPFDRALVVLAIAGLLLLATPVLLPRHAPTPQREREPAGYASRPAT
jgi:hypothetical protein